MPVKRPRDRKQQILAAASELFREHGYHNVSVADVSTKVEITASALYRHYRNKNDMLYNAVLDGLGSLRDAVGGAADLSELLSAMAARSADRVDLPLLWQREARYLDADQRRELQKQLGVVTARVAHLIAADRPRLPERDRELLALSLLAAFGSVAGLRVHLSRRRMEAVLRQIGERIAGCPLGHGADRPAPAEPTVSMPVSRREQLLTESIRLFDQRGYQSVLTEDIGEACGTTGPNVYNHFDAKIDILVAAVTRGFDRRGVGARLALSRATDPADGLRKLLAAHIEFALEDGHLIGLMATELDALPANIRKVVAQQQRDHLDQWVRILASVRPELERAEARITVNAVLTLVANAARTRALRARVDLGDRLDEIGLAALLGTDDPAGVRAGAAATDAR
ncbi:TetR/AcrR family transcriptional regulator [Rhodococcus olei]|uniref:TetR/AcrR family transcriptional regulator n=1 Tax=Rhodococcus olei TaxID=2161675 RepID=A0ABP8NUZ3_9NOCA